MTTRIAVVLCVVLTAQAASAGAHRPVKPMRATPFTARAYSLSGRTAVGAPTRRGGVAADPRILPLGSIVRIDSATGRRQGTYTVMDTGDGIKGRRVDIMPSCRAAKAFGVRRVRLAVVRRGLGSERTLASR